MPQINLSDQEIDDLKSTLDIALDQFQKAKGPAASVVNNPGDLLRAVGQTEDKIKALKAKLEVAQQAARNQP